MLNDGSFVSFNDFQHKDNWQDYGTQVIRNYRNGIIDTNITCEMNVNRRIVSNSLLASQTGVWNLSDFSNVATYEQNMAHEPLCSPIRKNPTDSIWYSAGYWTSIDSSGNVPKDEDAYFRLVLYKYDKRMRLTERVSYLDTSSTWSYFMPFLNMGEYYCNYKVLDFGNNGLAMRQYRMDKR
jgi:hypothetical protein